MEALDLVPFYLPESERTSERLAHALEGALRVHVRVRRPPFDPESSYDPSRGQYSSSELLRLLLEETDQPNLVLGVTGVDLFVPVLTFVFGEAQLGGRAAMVSLHRLRPEAYGLPPDEELLYERLFKEALHELGHVRGLLHCPDASCVMRPSTYVEQIDFKSSELCEACERRAMRSGASYGALTPDR